MRRTLSPLACLSLFSWLLQNCAGSPVVTSVVDCDPNLSFQTHEVNYPRSNAIPLNGGVTHESQVDGTITAIVTRQFQPGQQSCQGLPKVPSNSRISCTFGSSGSCVATCQNNYLFPNGENTMYLTCDQGEWKVQGADWSTLPACQPTCNPRCQNDGVCYSPNRCSCPADYSGAQCQVEDKTCQSFPKTPMNSRKQCSNRNCSIKCRDGTEFPGRYTEANFTCINGAWLSETRFDPQTIPDCEPICSPPCQNGGKCLPMNRCKCTDDFRGLQCQHSRERCSLKNMPFNGGHMCNGTTEYVTCSVSCPADMSFTFPPAPRYTCYYDTGSFSPSNWPQCQRGERFVRGG